ncbi:MAG: DsbC family protein [Burkholderiales bacterium]|nr:MAG: DsbC family protein [Burkholderiales bacterium]
MMRSKMSRRIAAPLMALATAVAVWSVAPAAQAQGAAGASAGDPALGRVKAAIEGFTKGRFKVEEVRKTPLPGIYEVRIGNDLIYVDEQGQYMLYEGDLIELKSQRNLTRERVEELLAIDFGTLPLDLAIRQVSGSGKRVLAVFEDPNCGYCKRLRADLLKLDDTTIYTFPMAFLAADSETKARKALCAADKARAWNELMLNNRVPGNAGTCDTSLAQVAELARKLGITGTPVVFFANGRRLQGYAPPERFNRMLAEYSKG